MNSRLNSVIFVIIQLAAVKVLADEPSYSNFLKNSIDNGKYIRRRNNEGRYIPMDDQKYIHVPDMREKGRYIHIPYPYDGGYGPYFGHNIPYDYDPTGEYSFDKFQTVSNPNDPFYTNQYVIPKPEIYLQYGFPQFSSNQVGDNTDRSASSSDRTSQYNVNTELCCDCPKHSDSEPTELGVENTESVTYIPINHDDLQVESKYPNTAISEIPNDIHKRIRKSIFDYSQTQNSLPKPTPRPRKHYDDEGKWKIIRQDENKKETNYEYLYETENGILAEEQAVVGRNKNYNSGTSGQGFYQYVGDDDRIYRVEYTVGEQGFVPKLVFPRGKFIKEKKSGSHPDLVSVGE